MQFMRTGEEILKMDFIQLAIVSTEAGVCGSFGIRKSARFCSSVNFQGLVAIKVSLQAA